MPDRRTATEIDALAERHQAASVALSPIDATYLGLPVDQDRYDDFSPEGHAARADLARATLAEAAHLPQVDEVDRITLAALRERLGLEIESNDAQADLLSVNGIDSNLHAVRDVYDQMPQETDDDWAMIARRLQAVPEAIDGWYASQLASIDAGIRPAIRQIDLLVAQTRSWAGEGGFFDTLAVRAGVRPASLTADLEAGIATAKQAYLNVAELLSSAVGRAATPVDAVGRERYLLASRAFLGATIDIDQTYAWGLEEVERVAQRYREVAGRIVPGGNVREAQAVLDADPKYLLAGKAELQAWMQSHADEAIARLVADGHFDIPEAVRRIECRIADTDDGGIYYTSPSEDFTRPGRMWWSVPATTTQFSTWRELTTVYHEGAPGHHLQISLAMANKDLNSWRRNGLWISGHGEGWALYAERLMGELGFLDDAGMMMGLLDSQALRAVRVVLDLGIHCRMPAPTSVGGGEWTFDKAWKYFNMYTSMAEGSARFEVLRYFGWPGQAPSYRIGEQHWLELRDQVRAMRGERFDMAEFHSAALALGTLGLDVLDDAVLTTFRDR